MTVIAARGPRVLRGGHQIVGETSHSCILLPIMQIVQVTSIGISIYPPGDGRLNTNLSLNQVLYWKREKSPRLTRVMHAAIFDYLL